MPTENAEKSNEGMVPNEPMKKEITSPNITKDEEDNEEINKESKEEIDKINIKDNICSPADIDLHNPDYEYNRSENNIIQKLMINYPEINPIEAQLFYK